jgi:hypothetical protein
MEAVGFHVIGKPRRTANTRDKDSATSTLSTADRGVPNPIFSINMQ